MGTWPRRGASKEYPQHMFLWSNKKNISVLFSSKNTLSGSMSLVILLASFQLQFYTDTISVCVRLWLAHDVTALYCTGPFNITLYGPNKPAKEKCG